MRCSAITSGFALLFLFCDSGSAVAAKAPPPCTRAQAEKAEAEADQLKGWNAVYLSFSKYAHCDDGAIAEGYSDSVAKLLANHWAEFRDLKRLTLESHEFSDFVLRHVDELMSPDEAKLIEQNARLRCPANGKALCRSILKQLNKAP